MTKTYLIIDVFLLSTLFPKKNSTVKEMQRNETNAMKTCHHHQMWSYKLYTQNTSCHKNNSFFCVFSKPIKHISLDQKEHTHSFSWCTLCMCIVYIVHTAYNPQYNNRIPVRTKTNKIEVLRTKKLTYTHTNRWRKKKHIGCCKQFFVASCFVYLSVRERACSTFTLNLMILCSPVQQQYKMKTKHILYWTETKPEWKKNTHHIHGVGVCVCKRERKDGKKSEKKNGNLFH